MGLLAGMHESPWVCFLSFFLESLVDWEGHAEGRGREMVGDGKDRHPYASSLFSSLASFLIIFLSSLFWLTKDPQKVE